MSSEGLKDSIAAIHGVAVVRVEVDCSSSNRSTISTIVSPVWALIRVNLPAGINRVRFLSTRAGAAALVGVLLVTDLADSRCSETSSSKATSSSHVPLCEAA